MSTRGGAADGTIPGEGTGAGPPRARGLGDRSLVCLQHCCGALSCRLPLTAKHERFAAITFRVMKMKKLALILALTLLAAFGAPPRPSPWAWVQLCPGWTQTSPSDSAVPWPGAVRMATTCRSPGGSEGRGWT